MTRKAKLWINGISGRVGSELQKVLESRKSYTLAGGLSKDGLVDAKGKAQKFSKPAFDKALEDADVFLDFSLPEANSELLAALKRAKSKSSQALVIGTTGLSTADKDAWKKATKELKQLRVLIAPNTSIGVLVASRISAELTRLLGGRGFDIEISETHHRLKKDAPSGTALLFADEVLGADSKMGLHLVERGKAARKDKEVGMVAQRGGGVFGEHTVRFISDHEEVSLSHRAFSRSLFAEGAFVLLEWLEKQKPGFYTLKDVKL